MFKNSLAGLLTVLTLAWPGVALSQALPVQYVSGRHVYQHPANFIPAGLSAGDIIKLEAAAKTSRVPTFVFLVRGEEVAGRSRDPGLDAIDATMQAWSSAGVGIDINRYVAFVWSVSEDCTKPKAQRRPGHNFCNFATSVSPGFGNPPGSYTKGEQEADRGAFIQAMRGRPQAPLIGIIGSIQRASERLFERTDPGRIAARQAAAEARAQAARLAKARSSLDAEIGILAGLLQEDPELLPADVSGYQKTLAQARQVRERDKPDEMAAYAADMDAGVDQLRKHVGEATSARRAKAIRKVLLWGVFLTAAFLLGLYLRRRYRYVVSLRENVEEELETWRERLDNAMSHYVDFDFKERSTLVAMDDVEGETRKLYDQVTSEVDNLYLCIKGLEAHIGECADKAKGAHIFNVQPLLDAQIALGSTFAFDTGHVNKGDLFGGETVTIQVNPVEFADSMQERFKRAHEGWQRLKKAAQARLKQAEESFPHDVMDELFDLAEKHHLPEAWIDDHPLFGDDDSDAAFYMQVNQTRWKDPVQYAAKLVALHEQQARIKNRLLTVIEAVQKVTKARIDRAIDLMGSSVHPKDDPNVILDQARTAEDRFQALVQSQAASKSTKPILDQANLVAGLYAKAEVQEAEIQAAVKGAETAIQAAQRSAQETEGAQRVAFQRLQAAQETHSKADGSSYRLLAEQSYRAGESDLKAARQALAESRHLDARRLAFQAKQDFEAANGQWNAIVSMCKRLDDEKAAFEAKLARMNDLRSQAALKVRRYNGGSRYQLNGFSAPSSGGAVDYATLLLALETQEQSWNRMARQAQRDYEAEQARIRAAEEARRRAEETAERARRQAEEEERRRSSYSSSSSWGSSSGSSSSYSSGSSWGSSSSYDSGSSYGSSDDY